MFRKFIIIIFITTLTLNNMGVIASYTPPKFSASGINKKIYDDISMVKFKQVFKNSASERYEKLSIDLRKRYNYSQIVDFIKTLSKSSDVKTFEIGESADKRKLYSLEIGQGKTFKMITAGIHARENANPIFLLKYVAILLNDYQSKKKYAIDLLSKNKLAIVPCVNPDGYMATQFQKKIIKNKKLFINKLSDQSIKKFKANAKGVDLNRNFPTYLAASSWGGKNTSLVSKKPASAYFAGYSLGSEPETKAIMTWLLQYIPKATVYVDLHQSGRAVFYGKPNLSSAYNSKALGIANAIKKITGYVLLSNTKDVIGDNGNGTITDFAAEVASDFVYNSTIKRLAPTKSGNNKVYKYNKLKWKVSICTVETMLVSNGPPAARQTEWVSKKLFQMFNKIFVT